MFSNHSQCRYPHLQLLVICWEDLLCSFRSFMVQRFVSFWAQESNSIRATRSPMGKNWAMKILTACRIWSSLACKNKTFQAYFTFKKILWRCLRLDVLKFNSVHVWRHYPANAFRCVRNKNVSFRWRRLGDAKHRCRVKESNIRRIRVRKVVGIKDNVSSAPEVAHPVLLVWRLLVVDVVRSLLSLWQNISTWLKLKRKMHSHGIVGFSSCCLVNFLDPKFRHQDCDLVKVSSLFGCSV